MLYGHGLRPWELSEYTWADVIKTLHGITQSNAPLRQAAYLIHASLIEKNKRVDVVEWMPLPFDEDVNVKTQAKRMDYEEVKERLRQIHGN